MGRFVLTVLVVLGICYGAWSLFLSGGGRAPDLSAREEAGPAASAGGEETGTGTGGAKAPAPDEERLARIGTLVARAERALARAKSAASREKSLGARDEARRLLSEALLSAPADRVADLRGRVEELNEEVLFSEEALPGKAFLYTVGPRDRLWTLCRKVFAKERGIRIEPGFLLFLNGIRDARTIREGQVLKVPTEELSLHVSKSGMWLRVLLGGVYLKEYPVGIGVRDQTPEGEFEVETKVVNPAWYSPEGRKIPFGSPENPLGSRWLGFKRTRRASGYGIHGTDDPETVGRAVSQGCVRMRNRDVEEIFSWVPRGTKVVISR